MEDLLNILEHIFTALTVYKLNINSEVTAFCTHSKKITKGQERDINPIIKK